MKKLNLLAIRIDGETQARVALDQAVVTEYAEHMKDGDKFPPIIVFHDGSDYWLADGFHRYFATKANGMVSIEAEVKEGTQRDATLYACGANGRRGLSMNFEDKRNIIKRMLADKEWGQWTNAQIAKHVGVSKMTVGRVKQQLEEEGNLKSNDTKKYVDRHGNESEIQTKNLGKKSSGEKKEKPAKIVPQAPQLEQEDQMKELKDTIDELAKENTLLKDKIAIGQWDVTEIEKIDAEELIADLRQQIENLERDNKALRESRDIFQNKNAELLKTNKALQAKLKKAGIE
jgi:polyhydroxyalkanoate synthesis regulator phasin